MNEGNFLSLRAEEHPKFFSTLIQLRFKKFDFIYLYIYIYIYMVEVSTE